MPLIKCSLVIKSNTIQHIKGDRGTFKQFYIITMHILYHIKSLENFNLHIKYQEC